MTGAILLLVSVLVYDSFRRDGASHWLSILATVGIALLGSTLGGGQ